MLIKWVGLCLLWKIDFKINKRWMMALEGISDNRNLREKNVRASKDV